MDLIQAFTNEQLKTEVPEFNVGDTVKVYQRNVEGQRVRTQIFEGTVIARKNGGISETFTVRRVSYGVGVEKTWPVNSPNIDKIEVVSVASIFAEKGSNAWFDMEAPYSPLPYRLAISDRRSMCLCFPSIPLFRL